MKSTFLTLVLTGVSLSFSTFAAMDGFQISKIEDLAQEIGKLCEINTKVDYRYLSNGYLLKYSEAMNKGKNPRIILFSGILHLKPGKTLDSNFHSSLKIRAKISSEIYTFDTDFCGVARLAADSSSVQGVEAAHVLFP